MRGNLSQGRRNLVHGKMLRMVGKKPPWRVALQAPFQPWTKALERLWRRWRKTKCPRTPSSSLPRMWEIFFIRTIECCADIKRTHLKPSPSIWGKKSLSFFFSERRNDLRGRQQFSPERPEVAVLGGRQAGPCAHCQPLQPQLPRQGLSRVGIILNYQRKAILLQYTRIGCSTWATGFRPCSPSRGGGRGRKAHHRESAKQVWTGRTGWTSGSPSIRTSASGAETRFTKKVRWGLHSTLLKEKWLYQGRAIGHLIKGWRLQAYEDCGQYVGISQCDVRGLAGGISNKAKNQRRSLVLFYQEQN